jgi:hypothetical protein
VSNFRKSQQWLRWSMVRSRDFGRAANDAGKVVAGTTLFDETPAPPVGAESGRSRGVYYGLGRGVIKGFGRP